MAILTGVGRADVGAVLAGGVDAIVAGRAVARDAGVLELSVIPRVGVVAIITSVTTGDVISRLALGRGAVVARRAGAEHGVVIHARDVLKA